MNKHIHQIFIVIFISLLWFAAKDSPAQTLKILPLGNSITEGWDNSLTDGQRIAYRSNLYSLLNLAGYSFDFVGHKWNGFDIFPDANHGGIPGTRDQWLVTLLRNGYDIRGSEQVTPENEPYLDIHTADIILLHIGTNDMINAEGDDPSDVEQILNEIDIWEAANGIEVVVFLARIINQSTYSSVTTDFNDNVEAMVALRGDPNIFMVDMEGGAGFVYDLTDMQADGFHPNETGNNLLGQAWFDALDPYLSSVPDAPSDLSATALDANSIQLIWTEHSANESGYRVERSESSGSGFSEIALLASNTTSYTDNSGLSEGTQYFYRVQAYNGTGNSSDSNEASATTPVSPPDAPTNLTFAPITTSSIQLNWSDQSDNENGFEIFVFADGSYSSLRITGPDVTVYNHTGLSKDTEYSYRVFFWLLKKLFPL